MWNMSWWKYFRKECLKFTIYFFHYIFLQSIEYNKISIQAIIDITKNTGNTYDGNLTFFCTKISIIVDNNICTDAKTIFNVINVSCENGKILIFIYKNIKI